MSMKWKINFLLTLQPNRRKSFRIFFVVFRMFQKKRKKQESEVMQNAQTFSIDWFVRSPSFATISVSIFFLPFSFSSEFFFSASISLSSLAFRMNFYSMIFRFMRNFSSIETLVTHTHTDKVWDNLNGISVNRMLNIDCKIKEGTRCREPTEKGDTKQKNIESWKSKEINGIEGILCESSQCDRNKKYDEYYGLLNLMHVTLNRIFLHFNKCFRMIYDWNFFFFVSFQQLR